MMVTLRRFLKKKIIRPMEALADLNGNLEEDGLPFLEMGIGINNGRSPVYRLHITYMNQADRELSDSWIRAA